MGLSWYLARRDEHEFIRNRSALWAQSPKPHPHLCVAVTSQRHLKDHSIFVQLCTYHVLRVTVVYNINDGAFTWEGLFLLVFL